jgi:hypothetical protein
VVVALLLLLLLLLPGLLLPPSADHRPRPYLSCQQWPYQAVLLLLLALLLLLLRGEGAGEPGLLQLQGTWPSRHRAQTPRGCWADSAAAPAVKRQS